MENSRQIVEAVTDEGVILTKNTEGYLPIAPQKINVFGWASTNPIYGGTGSGTVDASTAVGILQGLENAGFETNAELSQLYVDYRGERPAISINNGQDWTLPEIPAADYPADVLDRAEEFSDTAVIVISRTGGEGADLPYDMGPVMDGSTMEIGTKYMKGSYTNNSAEYADFESGQSYLELSRTERDLVEMVCGRFDDVIVIYNGANTLELDWTEEYDQIKGVLLCAGAGSTGFNALGNILSGEVNPSGKTTDTWLRDLHAAPYIHNIGHFAYTNTQETAAAAKAAWERADGIVSFVNYVEDMASYDTYHTGHYVLEEGIYEISLRTDSHTVEDSREYPVQETVIYDENQTHNGDLAAAENRFGFAEGDITYLSRADGFANYAQVTAAPASYELNGTVLANGTYDPTVYNNEEDVMPVTGARNGMELFDLRGADYDDPRWETLLDQVAVEEMVNLIAFGGHQNAAVDSVGKIRILDTDGPAGVNSSTLGVQGTGYCSEVVLAQTWNEDLAAEYARIMGEEFADFHITGWYAPSMNIHRSAFGGRDFEYYSEDSVLSARMAVAEANGAVESGMYPFIKHFVLNEQEINRNAMLCTWTTEQAMREIYMKPFEEAVKSNPDGKLAVMSSYNFIGTEWAGGCSELLKDVLRGEWGFKGMVLSDYFGNYGYMDADRAVRGGTDMMLGTSGNEAIMTDLSATSVLAMRQAVKNIFYTTVNSSAYENYVPGTIPGWLRTVYMVDAVIAVLWILGEAVTVRSYLKKKKATAARGEQGGGQK